MNIINKLTIRHLKENKRRTLVTIIGVIISVAMITAVATLGVSFLNLLIRDEIASNGEWHVQYKNVDAEQIEAIEKDKETKKVMVTRDLGYAHLPDSENAGKPYLFIKEYDTLAFSNFPIEISEGRLPLAENEVVISEEIENNAGVKYEVGEELTLEIGSRVINNQEEGLDQTYGLATDENGIVTEDLKIETTETFTIVGTIKRPTFEPSWAPGYTIVRYTDKSLVTDSEKANAVVVLKKVKGSLFKHAEELAEQSNISKVAYNSELLRYYGVTKNDSLRITLFSLAGIIMAVIIVGSVALIYNAFAISVSERSRHLGMLASVGATKKQKRNSVFFEGGIIGAISIPIGLLSGIGGIAITFHFINSFLSGALNIDEKFKVIVTPSSIIVACVISIVTIFISTFYPAKRASKVSAIDAIRQTQDVKLSRKAVKTSKLVRKFFGMEAEIGLKNLKRNKRRYQATVFSLVISIVLFLAVSFFTSNISKSLELSQDDISYDIQVFGSGIGSEELEPLRKLDYVTDSVMIDEVYVNAYIEVEMATQEIREQIAQDESILMDGKYPYYAAIHGLDNESFQEYANSIGADVEKLANATQPSAIIIERTKYQDAETGKFIEAKTIESEIGETLDLYAFNYEGNGEEPDFINKVEIGALTDQAPMGVHTASLGGLDIIVTKDTLYQLVGSNKQIVKEISPYLYMNSSDPLGTQDALDEITTSNMNVYNVYERRQEQEQLVILMSVFTYGFITLISLISVANIFNTISTSISLRKREFAMLRSVGMTPKGFNKMINYESVFYGIKALTYGLPISGVIMYLMYLGLRQTFEYGFAIPWMSVVFVIVIIFIIVGTAMLYSIQKIKKENIIDGLKQESI